MDIKAAEGRRVHFLITGTTTPRLIVGEGMRQAVVFVNESATFGIRVGNSGSVATLGTYIPPSQALADNYTYGDWWLVGSGTLVSGFVVY